MKPAAFEYVKAQSVEEVREALTDQPDAKILAGGQSLVPLMNFRLNRPGLLVDINGVTALNEVQVSDQGVSLGALVRHQRLVDDDRVRRSLPVLAEAARHIGHWAIRNRGTIGGSVAHADPAAELPALLVALGARIVVRSVRGENVYNADDFFLGYFTTQLANDELIVRIEIPAPDGRVGFSEVVRRPGDFALVGALVEAGSARPGVTWFGLGARPVRYPVDSWPKEDAERRRLLKELSEKPTVEPQDEYKRNMAVGVALSALSRAEEAN